MAPGIPGPFIDQALTGCLERDGYIRDEDLLEMEAGCRQATRDFSCRKPMHALLKLSQRQA